MLDMHKKSLTFVIVYRRCHYKAVYIWSAMHDHKCSLNSKDHSLKIYGWLHKYQVSPIGQWSMHVPSADSYMWCVANSVTSGERSCMGWSWYDWLLTRYHCSSHSGSVGGEYVFFTRCNGTCCSTSPTYIISMIVHVTEFMRNRQFQTE